MVIFQHFCNFCNKYAADISSLPSPAAGEAETTGAGEAESPLQAAAHGFRRDDCAAPLQQGAVP